MTNLKYFCYIKPSTVEVWPYVLVAFLMPIEHTATGNVGFTVWGISMLYFFIRDKRTFFKKSEIDFLLCLAPLLLYMLVLVGLVACETDECRKITFSFLERQLLFALYPLLFLIIPKFSKLNLEVILNWFCISQTVQLGIILLLPNYETVHYPYMGMYACFSTAYCLHLFFRDLSIFHLVLVILLLCLSLVVKAKVALFTELLLIVIILFSYRKYYLILGASIVVMVALFFLKVDGDFALIREYANSIFYIKSFSWKSSWQTFIQSNQYWLGLGVGNSEKALNNLYHESYPADWVSYMGYNSHNQYLETLLAQGWFGLGLLLLWILRLLLNGINQRKILLIYFILVITICSSTESILWREKGIVFLVFFSLLLIKYDQKEENNK